MKTTIKLRIELCLGNEGELPDVGTQIIDTSEKALLELFFPIMRQTLEQHLQGVSKHYGRLGGTLSGLAPGL